MSLKTRGATRADVLAVIVLGALGALVVPTGLRAQEGPRGKAERTNCANNLRQLGLSAIQYADDKRFYPHVGPIRALDGGYTTNTSTRVARSFLHFGYLDRPESFVCLASDDESRPLPEAAKKDLRRWGWGGALTPEGAPSPLLAGQDPALVETTELSFGWTRRGMTLNVRSTALLGADRLLEHHVEGGNVLKADGTLEFEPVARYDGPLTATEGEGAGYLGLRGKDDPAPKRAPAGGPEKR